MLSRRWGGFFFFFGGGGEGKQGLFIGDMQMANFKVLVGQNHNVLYKLTFQRPLKEFILNVGNKSFIITSFLQS